jgi:putative two-component system response regulator
MSFPLSAPQAEVVAVDEGELALGTVASVLKQLACRPRLFTDPARALAEIEAHPPDLVVTDEGSARGGALLRRLRAGPAREIPVLMTTVADPRPARRAALESGADDVIGKPLDPLELKVRVAALVDLSLARRRLAEQARDFAREVGRAVEATVAREREIIRRLALAAEHRDEQAGDHLSRVAGCSIAIAEALGLPEDAVNDIALASTMHDVGKIAVPDHVLLKAGPLTDAEREEMQEHAIRGFRILDGSSSRLIDLAAQIALSHHERWDGTGYPRGLKGEAIPIGGRIVAVADVFDALISERPYKKGWPPEQARRYVEEQAGSHFDPSCVQAFVSRWPDILELVAERLPTASRAA